MFGQLLMVSQTHDIDLAKVMTYPLNLFPWSLATSDRSLMKTNKAVLLHKLEEAEIALTSRHPEISDIHVIDGNALLQSLIGLPDTFGELALKVFTCLPSSSVAHFVTDRYDDLSIKDIERGRLLYFSHKDTCSLLSSEDGEITDSQLVQSLATSQEEADTKIILHCIHASMDLKCNIIIVRSPDTVVFLLLLAFADEIDKNLLFDTGTSNNRRQIIVTVLKEKFSPNIRSALFGLHSFTGCDTVSSFTGKGKIRPFTIMCKDQNSVNCFQRLGTKEQIDDTLFDVLQKFVCLLYGHPSSNKVNDVRLKIMKKRFTPGDDRPLTQCHGMDLSQLPPCEMSLKNHIKRANYQPMIWRCASQAHPKLPSPENNGWKLSERGRLEINWCDGDIFLNEIVDILSKNDAVQDSDDDQDSVASDDIEWLSESEEDITDSDTD
ncbi:hypothetical protein ElyMa_001590200 [Elysia marginata]|uniref:Uncharacterized protein n=1 Tax=Elysia marginata TaxID=1093978 RepID=A0AAV4JG54_9GAST|nr:hypothetical protein ElyMa_001590200 [Elysia marginata]